ncbi:hypothetical protein LUZ61_016096 [Rhynchospora tenuis]|uniref:BED-type domain-containing protein n=1 Tax=Rhynchospora tenuis TaxID=198213 RepID=A0AAD5Z4V1_9POAL|nr:hypothetical protein LUZ61_016096 [Rhynchospora tenuis]
MEPGIDGETAEEIQRIQVDADGDGTPPSQPVDDGTTPTVGTNKRKRKGRVVKNSVVWKHFKSTEKDEDGDFMASCNYCGTEYLQGNSRSTSSLLHHMRGGCRKMPARSRAKPAAMQRLLQLASEQGQPNPSVWEFDQGRSRKNLAKMVAGHEYPFNCATHHFFKVFATDLQPLFKMPSRTTLRADCVALYEEEKGLLYDLFAKMDCKIDAIRDTMKYIKHSQSRMEKFKLAASQEDVPYRKPAYDVQTRWNSTYLMLDLALHLKKAIIRYAKLDVRYPYSLSDEQWDHVVTLHGHLKVFYDATLKFSGTKYPTLNLFFPDFCEVYLTIRNMYSSPYPFIVDMGKEMFLKWNKYWENGNVLLAVACALDPRCKLHVVEYYFKMLHPSELQDFMTNLKQCFDDMFNEYLLANTKASQSQTGGTAHASGSSSGSVQETNTRAGLKDFLNVKKQSDPMISELDQYLAEPLDHCSLDDDFDILSWWKLKAPKYPVLARLARDVLAVPISTVASESAFSYAGRTLSPTRSSLNDESVEALICAQNWLRASVIDSGGQLSDDDEGGEDEDHV